MVLIEAYNSIFYRDGLKVKKDKRLDYDLHIYGKEYLKNKSLKHC